jgi:hypothetical protein
MRRCGCSLQGWQQRHGERLNFFWVDRCFTLQSCVSWRWGGACVRVRSTEQLGGSNLTVGSVPPATVTGIGESAAACHVLRCISI